MVTHFRLVVRCDQCELRMPAAGWPEATDAMSQHPMEHDPYIAYYYARAARPDLRGHRMMPT